MVKEFERAGFAVVLMCNLLPVAQTVGVNRMVPTISIPYPLGNPSTSKEEQHLLRRSRVEAALDALAKDIKKQTIFKVEI